jgi:hypothetical protein
MPFRMQIITHKEETNLEKTYSLVCGRKDVHCGLRNFRCFLHLGPPSDYDDGDDDDYDCPHCHYWNCYV